MGPNTERFEMRVDETLLERVDAWRNKQDDIPSRAEAFRRLIEFGLAATGDNALLMNGSEKLIVKLLCELHAGLQIKGELDPDFIQDAIYGGHYWALKWNYSGLFSGEYDDGKILTEVLDILDMWYFLESSHADMTQEDKDYIKANAKYVDKIIFPGFDGNNETQHMSIARFLIEKMDRFTEFKGHGDLNSHMPSLDIYRRMLSVFKPIRKNLIGRYLNAKEFVQIWNERIHPTMRDK